MPRRPLAIGLLVLLAAACAGGGTGAGSPTTMSDASAPAATPAATSSTAPESPAGSPGAAGSLTVYSGRAEELVGRLLEQFEVDTGIQTEVRYGDTAELAALILEEGSNSPADVYFAQDAGALGAVAAEGLLAELAPETLERVPEAFRSPDGDWVGVSGRARVVVYDADNLSPEDLPTTIAGYTDPEWSGRIGWAPTNGSFQAFVTAYRLIAGEQEARAWLEGIQANEPRRYESNAAIVQAVADGEVDVGFVNHYYLLRQLAEQGDEFPVRNHFLAGDDPGALVNVAGVGILESADNREQAEAFVGYLLSEDAQTYFAAETFEYPLIEGVAGPEGQPALSELETPEIDLSDLSDLQGTLDLLNEVGVLP